MLEQLHEHVLDCVSEALMEATNFYICHQACNARNPPDEWLITNSINGHLKPQLLTGKHIVKVLQINIKADQFVDWEKDRVKDLGDMGIELYQYVNDWEQNFSDSLLQADPAPNLHCTAHLASILGCNPLVEQYTTYCSYLALLARTALVSIITPWNWSLKRFHGAMHAMFWENRGVLEVCSEHGGGLKVRERCNMLELILVSFFVVIRSVYLHDSCEGFISCVQGLTILFIWFFLGV